MTTDVARAEATPSTPVLEIRGLRLAFQGEERRTVALDGIDLVIGPGEAVGVVGETGCGKTVTGLAAMRLLPSSARLSADVLRFAGRDILAMDDRTLRRDPGRRGRHDLPEPDVGVQSRVHHRGPDV